MLKTDEDALVCDFAETYHIYNWRSLPVRTAATLAAGLRDTSRIHLKMAGMPCSFERLLLAGVFDAARVANWQRTKDGQTGRSKPEMVVRQILKSGQKNDEQAVEAFTDGDAFKQAREKLLNGN